MVKQNLKCVVLLESGGFPLATCCAVTALNVYCFVVVRTEVGRRIVATDQEVGAPKTVFEPKAALVDQALAGTHEFLGTPTRLMHIERRQIRVRLREPGDVVPLGLHTHLPQEFDEGTY